MLIVVQYKIISKSIKSGEKLQQQQKQTITFKGKVICFYRPLGMDRISEAARRIKERLPG